MLEVALHNGGPTAPADTTIKDLLVGQDGEVDRAPVHRRAAAVREAALVHPDEQPLVPLVVLGRARGDLAVPGVADPQALELPFHVLDVAERRDLGMNAALDRGVLGRQAEGVPPERVQHVEAPHASRAGHDVADDVVAHVPHVGVPGRIGEHLEAVELRPRRVFGGLERAGVDPALLPLAVQFLRSILSHVKNYRPCHWPAWAAAARQAIDRRGQWQAAGSPPRARRRRRRRARRARGPAPRPAPAAHTRPR